MNQANLSSELLRTFITIVETGGFIRAAEHLHKTQSTISQQIKRLEKETETQLFASKGRQKILTPAGEILLSYAKQILALQNTAILAAKQTEIKENLRIGVSQGLSEGIFPQLLGRFATTYPGVKLFVETGHSIELIERYDRNEFDLLLTMEKDPTEGEWLATEDMVWIGKTGYEWSSDQVLRLASYSHPCQFSDSSTNALDLAGIPWTQVYTSTSLPGLMAAVRAGLGVTVRARNAVSAGTEILTPKFRLPDLPQIQVVLRNRAVNDAAQILAGDLSAAKLDPL